MPCSLIEEGCHGRCVSNFLSVQTLSISPVIPFTCQLLTFILTTAHIYTPAQFSIIIFLPDASTCQNGACKLENTVEEDLMDIKLQANGSFTVWRWYSLAPLPTHLLFPYLRKFISSITLDNNPQVPRSSHPQPCQSSTPHWLTHQAQYNTQTTGKWLTDAHS